MPEDCCNCYYRKDNFKDCPVPACVQGLSSTGTFYCPYWAPEEVEKSSLVITVQGMSKKGEKKVFNELATVVEDYTRKAKLVGYIEGKEVNRSE